MESANDSFPPADAENALNPGNNTTVDVDPISSQIADDKKGEKGGDPKDKKEKEKNDPMQTYKTTMIVSGAIIVVLGVALTLTKKLKENKS